MKTFPIIRGRAGHCGDRKETLMGHTRGVRENIRAALAWADPRPRRVGRRGLFLAFLTVLDAAYGYALLAPPPGAPALAYPLVPPETCAIAWLTIAAVLASDIVPAA